MCLLSNREVETVLVGCKKLTIFKCGFNMFDSDIVYFFQIIFDVMIGHC